MACKHRRKALRVLTGDLGPDSSARMLEHCRVCGECREAFDFAAAALTKSSTAIERPHQHAAGAPDSDPSRPSPIGVARSTQVRRNRRTVIIFGVAALAFMLAGITRGRGDAAAPADPSNEAVWRKTLSAGTPVVDSPAGTFEARPRVITALVPLGAGSFTVTVLDQSSAVVFRREEKPGERGCFVEDVEIAAPAGTFRAGRFVVPFPEESAMRLEAGQSYGVSVAIAGGRASASSVFQMSRSPQGQAAGGEER
jgi:hypothetical protein